MLFPSVYEWIWHSHETITPPWVAAPGSKRNDVGVGGSDVEFLPLLFGLSINSHLLSTIS